MATSNAPLPIAGSACFKTGEIHAFGGHRSQLATRRNRDHLNRHASLSIRSELSDVSRGGGSRDFFVGFILGGAVFGTLAYVFAPQIRKSLLNEDEYGFRRAKRPIYYDDGLEKTRQTLNSKISQLNAAIDNVSSRLRGVNSVAPEAAEAESEMDAGI